MSKLISITILWLFIISVNCKSIFVINSYDGDEDKLVSVAVLYRHGDRSPIDSYPTDPYYDASYWPEGYGQLVNKGIERQYELGKWFRQRYSTFLPDEYSPNIIRVLSTNIDRALMSAPANLAGLYPPPTSQIWNPDLLWEPIPIHILSPDNDEILAMNRECPKYNALYNEIDKLDYFKNITIEYADIFEYINNHTGRNTTTLANIANLHDVFYAYRNHNESYIPDWADGIDDQKFRFLAGLNFKKRTFTDELRRLKVGPFLNYLSNYFNDIIQNVTNTPKFLMLSAHDSTVSAVLDGMGAYDYWPPEFAATVIWELRQANNGTHYINLLYKRNSTGILEELVVNNCTFDCAFDDFKLNLNSVAINTTNWLEECLVSGSVQLKLCWSFLFLMFTVSFIVWF